jgi:hypothetical protein
MGGEGVAQSVWRRRLGQPEGAAHRRDREKTRGVPVILPVRAAVEEYLRLCPYRLAEDGPLFSPVGASRRRIARASPMRRPQP